MAENTKIEWTDATWNPVTGCSVVSPGCANCYAMGLAGTRPAHHPSRAGLTTMSKAGPVWNGKVRLNEDWLTQPLRWKRPRSIFVCAHGDLFHEAVPGDWIDRVFRIIKQSPQHTFQILTKRAARMRRYMSDPATPARVSFEARGEWPPRNAWLGVSTEDQPRADERVPELLATPAAVRFVSAEPLLGPIDFERVGTLEAIGRAIPRALAREQRGHPQRGNGSICGAQIDGLGSAGSSIFFFQTPDHMGGFTAISPREWPRLDWIIVGGESGPNARPMHPDWARNIRDQCAEAGVPFFFKQWGEWAVDKLSAGGDLGGDMRRDLVRHVCADRENDGHFRKGDRHMRRVGKARAGRLLDGRTHDDMPEGR